MEYILPGFYTSIQILVLLSIGFVTRKTGLIDENFQKSVSSFLIKAALPLYFFTNMGRADLSALRSSLYMPLAAVINVAAAVLLAFAVFRLMPLEKKVKRAGIALGTFGNAGYIPISLIEIFPMTIPVFSNYLGGNKAVVLIGVYPYNLQSSTVVCRELFHIEAQSEIQPECFSFTSHVRHHSRSSYPPVQASALFIQSANAFSVYLHSN